jgi:hypothetical protein
MSWVQKCEALLYMLSSVELGFVSCTTTVLVHWIYNNSCSHNIYNDIIFFFEIHAVQRRRSQHASTLTPMNTRTQTLPLWAPPKDWAPADMEILEVTTGASASTGTSLMISSFTRPINSLRNLQFGLHWSSGNLYMLRMNIAIHT